MLGVRRGRTPLRRAATEPDVVTVRASISPENAASLATGFTHVGEQWDEDDGTEFLFERAARDEDMRRVSGAVDAD